MLGEKLDTKAAKVGEDIGSALKVVSQHVMDGVTRMAQIFEVQLAERLKRLEKNFCLVGAKFSDIMKKVWEHCSVGARAEDANYKVMSSNIFPDARKGGTNDVSLSDALSDGKMATDVLATVNEECEESTAA